MPAADELTLTDAAMLPHLQPPQPSIAYRAHVDSVRDRSHGAIAGHGDDGVAQQGYGSACSALACGLGSGRLGIVEGGSQGYVEAQKVEAHDRVKVLSQINLVVGGPAGVATWQKRMGEHEG